MIYRYYNLSSNTVQHNLVGNIFCLANGGLIAAAMASFFGRLPVIFIFQCFALGSGVWAGVSTSFNSYLAARILQGSTATVGIFTGLMWIKHIFYFHEQARKINWWFLGIIASPYIGPMVASFVLWRRPWPWCYCILTLLNGICVLLTFLFLDEPFYNHEVLEARPHKGRRWQRLLGIEQ